MPELPEVETIRRTLAPRLLGQRIKDVDVRLPKLVSPGPRAFRALLKGRLIKDLRRRGKLLIVLLDAGLSLLIHLRMTGQLVYVASGRPEPCYTHIVFELDRDRLAYADLRQFGWLEVVKRENLATHPVLRKIGPDPFEMDEDTFLALLQRSRTLKALLLDQALVSGLGNIYVDESLFRAGLHPRRLAHTLSVDEGRRLFKVIREVLEEAIALRGSSVRNYVDGEGVAGAFQTRHRVYQRRGKPCVVCGTPIAYAKVVGRGTYFCPHCQK